MRRLLVLLPTLLAFDQCSRGTAIRVLDETGAPVPCATLTTVNDVSWTTDLDGYAAVLEPGLAGEQVWFTVEADGYTHAPDGFGFVGEAVALDDAAVQEIIVTTTGTPGPCSADDEQHRLVSQGAPDPADLLEIGVVDAETGRGVPLVFVEDGEHTWVTDNAGRVAWYDIDRMDTEITLELSSDGYAPQQARVTTTAGTIATVELERTQLAERIYRLTGEGLYRDSVLLGYTAPVPELSGRIVGQDSSNVVEYQGGLFWFWGDTNRPSYPLGNFYTTVATSSLSDDPDTGLLFDYVVGPDGFAEGVVGFTSGGPVWMQGPVVASDDGGLYARWDQVDASWASVAAGIAVWNDSTQVFDLACDQTGVAIAAWPDGPELAWDGYVYAYNGVRRPATSAGMCDTSTWEAFTAHVGGTPSDSYAWRAGEPVVAESEVVPEFYLWGGLRDPDLGQAVTRHSGSIAWSAWRRRFLALYTEAYGDPSFLGELWLAEADTPLGPWVPTRKVVTHEDYSLYNPHLNPMFDDGSTVYFEGSYSKTFSGSEPTPRYDYNQLMYKLDLDDVPLPVAVYELGTDLVTAHGVPTDAPSLTPAFFAWEAPQAGTVDLYWSGPDCAARSLGSSGVAYAFSVLADGGTPDTVPLWQHTGADSSVASTESMIAGYTRESDPLGYVWESPLAIAYPVADFLDPFRADAGPDQCVAPGPVALDASGSVGDITGYDWSWDGGSASGAEVEIELPAGVYSVTLTVTDALGGTRSDSLVVGAYEVDDDGDGYPAGEDCDDASAGVSPAAIEVCDAADVDEDCDGLADDLDLSVTGQSSFYADQDGDGHGGASAEPFCDLPASGYVTIHGDCDDSVATVSPTAIELCDAADLDEDCDGLADDLDPSATEQSSFYGDLDGDGYGGGAAELLCDLPASGYVTIDGDCDDTAASVSPAATELCDAEDVDEDCDGLADDLDPSATGQSSFYADADGDGHGGASAEPFCDLPASGYVTIDGDCDDSVATVSPTAIELCDGADVDEDCDGLADDLDPSATGQSSFYADTDGDGYGGAAEPLCDIPASGYVTIDGDCDDTVASVSPAAIEVCDGEDEDEDCDGLADDADVSATGQSSFYADGDGDGHGGGAAVPLCDLPEGYAEREGDCDDTDPSWHPGAEEPDCTDPSDYNCDGATGYMDADGDAFPACVECDDTRSEVHPDADERCNALDDDCDGEIDEDALDAGTWYADADGDGFTDPEEALSACEAPAGYAAAGGEDCDDADPAVFPGAEDVPEDAIDQDCDGADAVALVASDEPAPGGKGAAGCGCASTVGGSAWLLLAGLVAARRRGRIR